MKRPFYSLRTGILANLIFLILAAMLLINAVMIKLAENDLLHSRVREGKSLANALSIALQSYLRNPEKTLLLGRKHTLEENIKYLLAQSPYSEFVFVSTSGNRQFTVGQWNQGKEDAVALCRQSIVTGKPSITFNGSTWAVMWLGYENVKVSAPVKIGGRSVGAVAICSHLSDLYTHLRQSEKIILIYIVLNTIILLAAGMFLLSRVVIKPIQRLLKVTEEFEDIETMALAPEPSRNEIGQLSHSLRMMLNRLEQNKQQLKDHIASLERANEELRRTQEEVVRSEKLASVGRLAAGVAHEIGNPVGVVLGYLDLMKDQELSESEMNDALERCESEINRINRIIRQLLDYSRPSKPDSRPINVHRLLVETLDMLEPQPIMRDIEVQKNFNSPKDLVLGDESRLKQVFVNIIFNAADAIEEKRKYRGKQDDARISIETQNTGGTIKITFADTGCGIPDNSINRIFDPFFSTKEPGKGTGLGLAVSYRIIEQMGGEIRAESQEGEGTAIHVILPLFESAE